MTAALLAYLRVGLPVVWALAFLGGLCLLWSVVAARSYPRQRLDPYLNDLPGLPKLFQRRPSPLLHLALEAVASTNNSVCRRLELAGLSGALPPDNGGRRAAHAASPGASARARNVLAGPALGSAQYLPGAGGHSWLYRTLGHLPRKYLAALPFAPESLDDAQLAEVQMLRDALVRHRLAQFWSGALAATIALSIFTLYWWQGMLSGSAATACAVLTAVGGTWLPDWYLTSRARRYQQTLTLELPDAIELLALSVGSGESLFEALVRVSNRASGVAGRELKRIVAQVNSGLSLPRALEAARRRNDCTSLTRLVDALLGALERGAPLSRILHDQVLDSRHELRSELLAAGGRKEIWMLIPVVFLILPLTVIFALFPGLLALRI